MEEVIKSASSEEKNKSIFRKIEGTSEQVEQKDKLISKFALVIISGPSGVGKSEVVKRLSNYPELNSQQLIYATTRSPRNGEIEGQDYYFVSRKEFLERVANNQFLNYVEYNNNYYGVPLNSLKEDLLTKNILHIVNVEGF
jgi:guanylate kinase